LRDNVPCPFTRFQTLLRFIPLEYGTDTLSPHVGNGLPLDDT
jgi:hypothetical protein